MAESLVLDSSIRDWILIPIMAVMILTGILRHHIATLMLPQNTLDLGSIREMQAF